MWRCHRGAAQMCIGIAGDTGTYIHARRTNVGLAAIAPIRANGTATAETCQRIAAVGCADRSSGTVDSGGFVNATAARTGIARRGGYKDARGAQVGSGGLDNVQVVRITALVDGATPRIVDGVRGSRRFG